MIHIEHFTFNLFQERCCVTWDDEGFCAVIDPGCCDAAELEQITGFIEKHNLKPVCIMLTHGHFDHIYGMSALTRQYGIPVYAHLKELSTLEETNPYICRTFGLPLPETFPMIKRIGDAALPGRFYPVKEGDTVEVGSLRFEVLETPGHTKGGVCYLERTEKLIFCGDTLFAGAIGRTDHPGGDYDQLMKSIFEKLMPLDGDINVVTGHGPMTDIATERMTNPFLMPFNEPNEE